MSTLLLEESLRGGALYRNRNLDLTLEAGLDLSDYQYTPISIDVNGQAILFTSLTAPFVGILQNESNDGIAHIRYAGVSRVVIADTVTAGDLVHVEAGGAVTKFVVNTDGHVHSQQFPRAEKVLIRVTEIESGDGVTGLTDAQINVTQLCRDGSMFTLMASTYVTEDMSGGGWYEVGTIPEADLSDSNDTPHSLLISLVGMPENIVTPSLHSWTPHLNSGTPPHFESASLILGPALEDGVADDAILVLLQPQRF